MRYLDIIKYFEKRVDCNTSGETLPSIRSHEKNLDSSHGLDVKNVKSQKMFVPGTSVQWKSVLGEECRGQVLLSLKNGWFVIQEYSPQKQWVCIHTKTGIKVVDSPGRHARERRYRTMATKRELEEHIEYLENKLGRIRNVVKSDKADDEYDDDDFDEEDDDEEEEE